MVDSLEQRAAREGLTNLESRLGLLDDPQLPDDVDLVLMVDTHDQIGDRTAYFARVAEQLAPGARLAIVDFEMGDRPIGPRTR